MHASPLQRPVQIAYAVTDVIAAAQRFAGRTGAGPFFFAHHIALDSATIDGKAAAFDHSSAFGQWGDLMVELIHEHTRPLVAPGSVHHMAFMVDDLLEAIQWCGSNGWAETLFARTSSGQEFAFCDARADLGHLLELYEPSPPLLAFYEMVANAARASA